MKDKMKAVIKTRGEFGGTELKKVDIPKIGPGDVLIEVKVASICGTDFHIYKWDKWAEGRIKPPLLYGHEFCGEVVETGSNVRNVKVGDYVSGECHIACGFCHNCRTGLAHICENVKIFGVDVTGIFAEYASIPAANVWRNDRNLPPKLASIQDPLGNAVHTVFASDVVGKSVAIFGCGPIGMMATTICNAIGAAEIFCVGGRNRYKVDRALEVGGDYGFLSAEDDVVKEIKDKTGGRGVDVALEMSGNPRAINDSLEVLAPGGELVVLGVFSEAATIDLSKQLVFKGTKIIGINGRRMFDTWYRMAGLLKSGKLNLEPIITHEFDFEDFEKGIKAMLSGQCGKVVLYLDRDYEPGESL